MKSHKGLIIYFDGPDGAGKSTQLKMAAGALRAEGHKVFETRTMGGTIIGEKLREALLAETERPAETDLHIAVATQYALADEVRKRRNQGEIVLLDRSPLSIIGYQVYADGLDKDLGFETVADLLDLFQSDLLIIYTASKETLAVRRLERNRLVGTDYFENKPADYHNKVAKGFADAAVHFGACTIDAEADLEHVHDATMKQIKAILKP